MQNSNNNMSKCSFCGSETIFITTPYIDPITGKKKKTECCGAQKTNIEYAKKRLGDHKLEHLDEVSKI